MCEECAENQNKISEFESEIADLKAELKDNEVTATRLYKKLSQIIDLCDA